MSRNPEHTSTSTVTASKAIFLRVSRVLAVTELVAGVAVFVAMAFEMVSSDDSYFLFLNAIRYLGFSGIVGFVSSSIGLVVAPRSNPFSSEPISDAAVLAIHILVALPFVVAMYLYFRDFT